MTWLESPTSTNGTATFTPVTDVGASMTGARLALSGLGLFVGGIALAVLVGAYGAERLWKYCEARR